MLQVFLRFFKICDTFLNFYIKSLTKLLYGAILYLSMKLPESMKPVVEITLENLVRVPKVKG